MDDEGVVARQLGRAPRGTWRVVTRCSFGFPVTIATAPITETGEPFPTLFYLTCPHLIADVSALESAGELDVWRQRIASEDALARRMLAADAEYRNARAAEGGGSDPVPGVGIAGMRDPLAVKCLHAHVAAVLAGIDDPVGEGVLEGLVLEGRGLECTDERCSEERSEGDG